jgi:hypothetical protein
MENFCVGPTDWNQFSRLRLRINRMESAEMLKILTLSSLMLGFMALAPIAQARATHSNPDHYVYLPPHYDIHCQEARILLQKEGYHVSKTIRCGGNYHQFRAQRSGRNMIVQVMTCRGKGMIDARSGSRIGCLKMASY